MLGGSLFIFGRQFLALFTTEGAVIDAGMKRVGRCGFAYCISAFMDCTIVPSRGLGKTVVPIVIVVLGPCVFRVIWVYTIFAHFHTIPRSTCSTSSSWTLTAIAEIVYFIHAYKDSMKISYSAPARRSLMVIGKMLSPRDGISYFLLLIIVVEEHGFDLDDPCHLFLLHLNVGVDPLRRFFSLESFGQSDGPASRRASVICLSTTG